MQIKQIFKRDIERNIDGVIKVHETSDLINELEEYVVTNKIDEHFRTFFNLIESIDRRHESNTGVWISGYYGSGKSHFLKILSIILDNQRVEGKQPIEYLEDKIDSFEYSKYDRIVSNNIETILFNIDAEARNMPETESKLISAFMTVFYNHLGYTARDYNVVKVEQLVDRLDKLGEFKERVSKTIGRDYSEIMKAMDLYEDEISKILASLTNQSMDSAKNFLQSKPPVKSISDFVDEVKEYVDKKGADFKLFFMADEIGQFIGNSETLILNLQTLQEELEVSCNSQVFLVVTAQEDIENATKFSKELSSKIIARFKTRMKLTSENAGEVIKIRVLEKNEDGDKHLRANYAVNQQSLKNLITFGEGTRSNLTGFINVEQFVTTYPFLPYSFELFQTVIENVSKRGQAADHVSRGERSMLNSYQQIAKNHKDETTDLLISFDEFFDTISGQLDSDVSRVFGNAQEQIRNRQRLEAFDLRVLQVLFLIGNAETLIQPTVDNITTLLVRGLDEDKFKLKEQIQRSLDNLLKENYINVDGNLYNFLTDEEQRISTEIKNLEVPIAQIEAKIKEIIQPGIISQRKFNYSPTIGKRKNIDFRVVVDDESAGDSELVLRLVFSYDLQTQLMKSSDNYDVRIVFSNPKILLDTVKKELQITNYNRQSLSTLSDKGKSFFQTLRQQYMNGQTTLIIKEQLAQADYVIHGYVVKDIASTDTVTIINRLFEKAAEQIFPNFTEITTQYTTIQEVYQLLSREVGDVEQENKIVKDRILKFIQDNQVSARETTVLEVYRHFGSRPFGFTQPDVSSCILGLLIERKIELFFSASNLKAERSTVDLINDTKKSGNLKIVLRKQIAEETLNQVKSILANKYHIFHNIENEDLVVEEVRKIYDGRLVKLRGLQEKYSKHYPKEDFVHESISLFETLNDRHYSNEKILDDFIKDQDQIEKTGPMIQRLEHFFQNQVQLYDDASLALDYYQSMRTLFDGSVVEEANAIKAILNAEEPFQDIPRLSGPIKTINNQIDSVYNKYKDEYSQKFNDFKSLIKKQLDNGLGLSSDFKTRILKQIENEWESKQNEFKRRVRDVDYATGSITILDDFKNNVFKQIQEELRKLSPKEKQKLPVYVATNQELMKPILLRDSNDVKNYLNDIEKKLNDFLKIYSEIKIESQNGKN